MGKYVIESKFENTRCFLEVACEDREPYFFINRVDSLTPYTEPDLEQIRKETYQRGLSDAWNAARKLMLDTNHGGLTNYEIEEIFGVDEEQTLIDYSASEVIKEIWEYEQAQKEKEEQEEKDSVTAEEVMRQYLDTFCKHNFCTECLLHTPDFTCGRGYHFLTHSRISDEEVRRAYAEVLAKMKE